jgi:2-furoyl-CoA dehydrogenase large subunit
LGDCRKTNYTTAQTDPSSGESQCKHRRLMQIIAGWRVTACFDGQVCGGFAMAVGAALYERLIYAADGGFITGSLLDYALPTASVIPDLETLHQQTPSPVTPLGTKGVAEGHSMSTPVRIANAVADALGVAEAIVPLTPERVLQMVRHRGQ